MTELREQAALVALVDARVARWYEVADLVEVVGSAESVVAGELSGLEPVDLEVAHALCDAVTGDEISRWSEELAEFLGEHSDVDLVTVLDDDYPRNLREIYDRPPFVFVRGTLRPEDEQSVAMVGTRRASPEGRAQARELASALAEAGVTVVSGLASGIDTAAHAATLDSGGRTLAVMGTGVDRIYPAENAELAERITESGALISQFLPGSPPRRENFPIRNAVTSGMAVGTVVIEASSTSGAKMQARLALEHGKRLFLVRSLVMQEDWAREYAKRPGAMVVDDVREVLELLTQRAEVAQQLHLV